LVAEEPSTGIIPDRRKMPVRPYRPSATDFLRAEWGRNTQLTFWSMTTGVAPVASANDQRGIMARGASASEPAVKLNLGLEPERFLPIFERALSRGGRPHRCRK
jgi:hypothetical protein